MNCDTGNENNHSDVSYSKVARPDHEPRKVPTDRSLTWRHKDIHRNKWEGWLWNGPKKKSRMDYTDGRRQHSMKYDGSTQKPSVEEKNLLDEKNERCRCEETTPLHEKRDLEERSEQK